MTAVFAADGQTYAARGVRGGGDGNVGRVEFIDESGIATPVPNVCQVEILPGQWLRGLDTAGGGYGDPLERSPEAVREDLLERFVTAEHASEVYGVVFDGCADDESLAVDQAATDARRTQLRDAQSGGRGIVQ